MGTQGGGGGRRVVILVIPEKFGRLAQLLHPAPNRVVYLNDHAPGGHLLVVYQFPDGIARPSGHHGLPADAIRLLDGDGAEVVPQLFVQFTEVVLHGSSRIVGIDSALTPVIPPGSGGKGQPLSVAADAQGEPAVFALEGIGGVGGGEAVSDALGQDIQPLEALNIGVVDGADGLPAGHRRPCPLS